MALSVVQTTGLASVTASVSIVTPTSATDGDLLVLALNWDGFPTVTVDPSPGWTLLTAGKASDGASTKVYTNLYYKHASSEPASYSAHFSFAPNWSYQFVVIRGQNGSTTAIDSPANISVGAVSTMACPAVTISHAGSLRLIFNSQIGNNAVGPLHFEVPTGYTDGGAQVTSTVIACASFSKIIASSGTDAAIAAMTVSSSVSPFVWTSITLAIAASGAAAGSTWIPMLGSLCLQGVGR